MKISTGLEPKVWVIPIRERTSFDDPSPFPTMMAPTGWRIDFTVPDDHGRAMKGTIISSVYSYFEPKIERKGAKTVFTDESENREEQIAYLRERYQIPDDCAPEVSHDTFSMVWTFTYNWWEVTA